jgi:hypothetical protein
MGTIFRSGIEPYQIVRSAQKLCNTAKLLADEPNVFNAAPYRPENVINVGDR